jgi:starch synthase
LLENEATGFVFEDASLDGLLGGVRRALALYREPLAWRRLQLRGMAQDFSWSASAAKYAALYSEASGLPCPTPSEAADPSIRGRQAAL